MLQNGNFTGGWEDLPPLKNFLINQRPNGWQLEWLDQGELLYDDPDTRVDIIPECVHKLSAQLPENEQLDGRDALILDGDITYKIFSAAGKFGATLSQTVTGLAPSSQAMLTVPIQVHMHGETDADGAASGVWVNGEGGWVDGIAMGDRQWYRHIIPFTVPDSGEAEIVIRVKSKSDKPKDFFFDGIKLEAQTNAVVIGDAAVIGEPRLAEYIPSESYLEQRIETSVGSYPDIDIVAWRMANLIQERSEKYVQQRRFEAALPKSVHFGDTTELLTMIPRVGDAGLSAFLPIETAAGDLISKDDVSAREVELEFPLTKEPVLVFISVETSKHDFEVENPIRAVKIYPDREGDYETFFLTALRVVNRARVAVRLFIDKELTTSLGTLRFDIPIEPDDSGIGERLQRVRQQERIFALARMPLTYVAGSNVGGDMINATVTDSTGVALGREAQASVQVQQGIPAELLNQLFAPLLVLVAEQNPTAVSQVLELKDEAGKGTAADDEKVADLIGAIAEAAPDVVENIVNLFTNSVVAKVAGGATKYVLKCIRE